MMRNMARSYVRRCSGAMSLLAWGAMASVHAQSAIPPGTFNLWLAEQPIPEAPLFQARIAGVASYKNYEATATLAFACRTDGGRVWADLVVDPKTIGFDADPYEGPDATAGGPIVITSGSDAAIRSKVSGSYGDGGPFNTGTPFRFQFAPDQAAVARWSQAGARGKPLHIVVPAASGGTGMTVDFRWPDDDGVFRQVVAPCLGKLAQH